MDQVKTKAKVVLLDIEGTTTPITFVKEILFPYAAENVEDFFKKYWEKPEVQYIISELRRQSQSDVERGLLSEADIIRSEPSATLEEVQSSVVKNVLWHIKQDLKRTAFKALQGKIWKLGFENGKLSGQFFQDVPEGLRRLTGNGQSVCIYSSGSVDAQKLVFKYSEFGDLSPFITDYFDTQVGAKGESQSYSNIAEKLQISPENILFATDIPTEAFAAREAGMDVILMVRPGNAPVSESDLQAFRVCQTFDQFC